MTELDIETTSKDIKIRTVYGEHSSSLVLSTLAKYFHRHAVSKGFWEGGVENSNFGEKLALIHSEISEALEAHRTNSKDQHLPEYPGEAVELADALIRILNVCGANEWPIGRIVCEKMAFNATRPYKHGKKY